MRYVLHQLNQPTVINGVQRYSVRYSVAPDTDTAGDTASSHPIQREMPCRLNSTAARPHSSFVLNNKQKDAPVKGSLPPPHPPPLGLSLCRSRRSTKICPHGRSRPENKFVVVVVNVFAH